MELNCESPIVLKFYLGDCIQIKLNSKYAKRSYFLLTTFENIDEKIALGDMHNKLNYSYMLICSLSHELFTPINHLLNCSQQLLDQLFKIKEGEAMGIGDRDSISKVNSLKKCIDDSHLILSISEGLTYFVQNILDFAKYINKTLQVNTKDVKLATLMDRVTKLFRIKARRKDRKSVV